jgi:hypothetical protein
MCTYIIYDINYIIYVYYIIYRISCMSLMYYIYIVCDICNLIYYVWNVLNIIYIRIHTYNGVLFKEEQILSFARKYTELEAIMWSKISKSDLNKKIAHVFSYIQNLDFFFFFFFLVKVSNISLKYIKVEAGLFWGLGPVCKGRRNKRV